MAERYYYGANNEMPSQPDPVATQTAFYILKDQADKFQKAIAFVKNQDSTGLPQKVD